jgi:RIO kinase 1
LHTETLEDALDPFIADGLITEVLYPIKSGKEATVYCCRAGTALDSEFVAAKVYKPKAIRSFRDDSVYRAGRVILDRRARRAAAKRTDFGQQVQSALWTNHEWSVLKTLHAAGADVPRPLAHSARGIRASTPTRFDYWCGTSRTWPASSNATASGATRIASPKATGRSGSDRRCP